LSYCDAFTTYREGPFQVVNGLPSFPYTAASLAHLDLHAGKYVIIANARFTNDSPPAPQNMAPLFCGLTAQTSQESRQVGMLMQPMGSPINQNVCALSAAVTLALNLVSPDRVFFWAYNNNPTKTLDVKAYEIQITAIKVGNLTFQGAVRPPP
jgi:hypothetical protein